MGVRKIVSMCVALTVTVLTHLLVFRAPLAPRICFTLIRDSMTREATLLKKFCDEISAITDQW